MTKRITLILTLLCSTLSPLRAMQSELETQSEFPQHATDLTGPYRRDIRKLDLEETSDRSAVSRASSPDSLGPASLPTGIWEDIPDAKEVQSPRQSTDHSEPFDVVRWITNLNAEQTVFLASASVTPFSILHGCSYMLGFAQTTPSVAPVLGSLAVCCMMLCESPFERYRHRFLANDDDDR